MKKMNNKYKYIINLNNKQYKKIFNNKTMKYRSQQLINKKFNKHKLQKKKVKKNKS